MQNSRKLSKLDITLNGKTPIYSSETTNNGIIGYCDKSPSYIVDESNPLYLIFGDHTRNMNIAEKSFCIADNVKVLVPKINSKKALLYITTIWKKGIPNLGYSRHWSKAKDVKLLLPTNKKGRIDINFMETYINEIEKYHIGELKKERKNKCKNYLKVAGYDNYRLNEDEKKAITSYQKRTIKYKKFKIEELFEVTMTKRKFNANTIKFNGGYPYVARGSSNNGIKGYIMQEKEYLNEANTISFGQDTATMFFQKNPYFTGDKIKIMKYKNKELNADLACYLITSMKKAFQNFSWGASSFNEKVINNVEIEIPIKENNEIDYDFISNFISAQKKNSIKEIMDKENRVISITEKIVS